MGHVDCVQLLLSHDAPVDSADESGRTALMMAAEKGRGGALGNEICVCVCVFEGCSVCLTFIDVCVCSVLFGAPEVLLTSAGASLSLTDKDGNTALHLACSNVCVHKGASSSKGLL